MQFKGRTPKSRQADDDLRYGSLMDRRLDGWSEIGAFFGKSGRTAQRWAERRGLRVHHLTDRPKSPVFAHESELRSWAKANSIRLSGDHDDIVDRLAGRLADLSQARNLYRKNFLLRFVLQKFGSRVKAQIYTEYEIVNGSNRPQPYTQEITVDDCEAGQVDVLSVSLDGKPIYLLRRPGVTKRHLGYSSYKGRPILIEPSSSGKRYVGVAEWTIIRHDTDFWYLHVGIPTLGVQIETVAPVDFEITESSSTPELITVGQHIDVTWRVKRRQAFSEGLRENSTSP